MYWTRTLTAAVMLLLSGIVSASARPAGEAGTRPGRIEAGMLFSVKGCGLVADFPMRDGGGGEFRVLTDFEQVLSGAAPGPGIRVQFFRIYRLRSFRTASGMHIHLSAGPGLTGGFVRDHGKDPGYLAAASGTVGAEFVFTRIPVTIRAGVSGDLGVHLIYRDRYDNTLTFYQNGLRTSLYPELTLKYRF